MMNKFYFGKTKEINLQNGSNTCLHTNSLYNIEKLNYRKGSIDKTKYRLFFKSTNKKLFSIQGFFLLILK